MYHVGEGNGNPLQYSCLENPMNRGAWWATSPQGHKESDTTERLHFHVSCRPSTSQLTSVKAAAAAAKQQFSTIFLP